VARNISVGIYGRLPDGAIGDSELIDASTGTILAQLESGEDFARATFADNRIFSATVDAVAA
jgi:hypothetical protein